MGSVGAAEFPDVDLGLLGEEVVAVPVYLGEGWRDRPLSSALRGDVQLLSLQDWSLLSALEFSSCRYKRCGNRPGTEQGVTGFSWKFKTVIGILKFLAASRSRGLHWGWPMHRVHSVRATGSGRCCGLVV